MASLKQKTTKSSFLQNQLKHSCAAAVLFLLFLPALAESDVIRKSTVTFPSGDSLLITADQYIISSDRPYILLLHEQGSSRGEFRDIAERFCKMDYNCMAVDLRNGGTNHYVSNQTTRRCREIKCPASHEDIEMDIRAAIGFAVEKSQQPVILFGCGANGSLALKLTKEHEEVRAGVALSPGEYFLPDMSIRDTIAGLNKPVFVSSSKSEYPYLDQLVSKVEEENLVVFEPELAEGQRGSASLESNNENHSEYWLALLLFFKELL